MQMNRSRWDWILYSPKETPQISASIYQSIISANDVNSQWCGINTEEEVSARMTPIVSPTIKIPTSSPSF